MKKITLLFCSIGICSLFSGACLIYAEEGTSSQELSSDRQQFKQELDQKMLIEDKKLRERIKSAIMLGDKEGFDRYLQQLILLHQHPESVKKAVEGKKDNQADMQELQK